MASSEPALAPADLALFERVAARVVELRLEVPAVLTLESCRPLSLLASQAMIFFEPLAQSLLRLTEYRRLALLLERRDALETLARLIETQADEARARRRERAPGAGPGRQAANTPPVARGAARRAPRTP
ncbi:MAG: hypothetical protein HZC42_01470 [Candidatus Eisenbacteria bacterium]|nr:hypothetical protein [Candidatus Eisenbacteria bacterium]